MPPARKVLLAALLFVAGYLTMQGLRCDARGASAPSRPQASEHP